MDTTINRADTRALLEEYRRALNELIALISQMSAEQLQRVLDTETQDPDCISVQAILSHVVHAGYGYCVVMENQLGYSKQRPEKELLDSVQGYIQSLNAMYAYHFRFFEMHPDLEIVEKDNAKKIQVSWGQWYDREQLLEYAIVHILRHRRQIENFVRSGKLRVNP